MYTYVYVLYMYVYNKFKLTLFVKMAFKVVLSTMEHTACSELIYVQ